MMRQADRFSQRNDSSPASFEKSLSTLSKKISDTQARLDRVRSSSRRVKVLWTLYLSFAYLVYAIVLTLVVGWHNLGAWEWTGMAGGPVAYVLNTSYPDCYTTR
jgi:endoplasmic reticulum junction formation protein lunapark